MNQLRATLPPIPSRWWHLEVDDRGYPVPYFVARVNGKPDFRVMDGEKLPLAVKYRKCWLCGQQLGKFMTFVLGPMCAINRTISEPPSHHECAHYGVRTCPFLTLPKAKRRENNLPENAHDSAGYGIKRNPGVTLLWTTKSYKPFGDGMGGVLFRPGDPVGLDFFAEGRSATLAEVMESIETGLPFLREAALADVPEARVALEKAIETGLELVRSHFAAHAVAV